MKNNHHENPILRALSMYPDVDAGLEALKKRYGIKYKSHPDGRTILNYSEIESPKGGITDSCRGFIFDRSSLRPVAYSFSRFYNWQERYASNIDWKTASVQEKLDGSLMTFYHWKGKWRVSSRGTIEAEVTIPSGKILRQLVDITMRDSKTSVEKLFDGQNTDLCFVCEFVSQYNRIVTHYEKPDLYLLATIDRTKMEDIVCDTSFWPFSRAKVWSDLDSIEKMQKEFEKFDLEEGFVVRDKNNNRIKVKSPKYVKMHRLINAGGEFSPTRAASLALMGDTDEIKGHFPELKENIEQYETLIKSYCSTGEEFWERFCSVDSRKGFAKLVMSQAPRCIWSWLFLKRDGVDTSCREWIKDINPKNLLM